MELLLRLVDLVGCTIVEAGAGHVVFWNGMNTLLRYKVEGGMLHEAGSYTCASRPESASAAADLASYVSFR